MLLNEAQWIGIALDGLDAASLSPVLNVGSATASFRKQVQPWIDKEIFAPLRNKGVVVHHLDMQEGDGIDLRGDLTNDMLFSDLTTLGYRTVMCCNVLEHIVNPVDICAKLERLVPSRGYILVTVPNRFPYHPDPIDTMFRPDLQELVGLFPHCRLVTGAVLDCGTGWDYVERDPRILISTLKRRIVGMREHGGLKGSASFFPWLVRRFWQTAALLQRESH